MNGNWRRVSRSWPCPVCGHPDWCLLHGPEDDPDVVICPRMESPKRCGEAGWLHRLREGVTTQQRRPVQRIALDDGPRTDFADVAESYRRCVEPDRLRHLAQALGLQSATLERFGVGWSPGHNAWSFPMRGGDGVVVGIHLRTLEEQKRSVKGSKQGLFLPADPTDGDQLLIAEGMSDAAALVEVGFAAIGRPSCSSGIRAAVAFLKRARPPSVVIAADGDEPGRRGASNLGSVLAAYVPEVRVIVPPEGIKDVRAWYRQGCTRQDVQQAINAAPVRRLAIRQIGGGECNHE